MGQVHSQTVPGAAYSLNPQRLSVREVLCCVNEGDVATATVLPRAAPDVSTSAVLARIVREGNSDVNTSNPNADSVAPRLRASRPDGRPLNFVLDPETQEFVLQLPYTPSISLRFNLSVAVVPGTSRHPRLVFARAGSAAELQQVIAKRQTEAWIDVASWTDPAHPKMENLSFLYVWDALEEFKPGGQPLHFAFFFDDSSGIVTSGALWMAERPANLGLVVGDDDFSSVLYEPQTISGPASAGSPNSNQSGHHIQPFASPTNTQAPPTPAASAALTGSPGQYMYTIPTAITPSDAASVTPTTSAPSPSPSHPLLLHHHHLHHPPQPSQQQPPQQQQSVQQSAQQPAQQPQQTQQQQPQQPQQQQAQPQRSGDTAMPYGVPLTPRQDPVHLKAARPDTDQQFQPEDGPQFRSAIATMERRVPALKTRVKQLLKRGLMSRERLQALIEADSWLASGIQEAASRGGDLSSLKPVSAWFSRSSEGGLSAIQRQRKVSLNELTTRIIEPLQRFYEYDIKSFEQRKREFEEESSQFYSWTSRYLSARKEARRSKTSESADTKFAAKKRAFDAARFDYFCYLSDLTSGLKQQVMLQLFALAAQSVTDSHIALGSELATRTQPLLDGVVADIKSAAREWEKHRLDRLAYRRLLDEEPERGSSMVSPPTTATPSTSNATTNTAATVPSTTSGNNTIPKSTSMTIPTPSAPLPMPPSPAQHQAQVAGSVGSTGSMDDQQASSATAASAAEISTSSSLLAAAPTRNYKEGLLWASNRPGGVQDSQSANKQVALQQMQNLKWHKYWVVLDGATLREYTNWKQSVDLHNEPINLLVAAVREARNTDRRFCFEVVTPQYKRVYQATSEEDMRTWISAIRTSISTLLEGTDDQQQQHPHHSPLQIHAPFLHHQHGSSGVPVPGSSGSGGGGGANLTSAASAGSPHHHGFHPRESELEVMKRVPSSSGSGDHGGSHYYHLHKTNGERIESLTRKLSFGRDKPRVPPIITSLGQQHGSNTAPFLESAHVSGHNKQSGADALFSPPPQSAPPQQSSAALPFDDLISKIQMNPSNRICAECNATKSVEWVSINLLVVLCIECSGAHRSLGSHISKVRSLTLDIGAFNPSLKTALLSVSNEVINRTWEANLPADRKLTPDASSVARVKYVTEKYVEKQFINEIAKPNTVLRRAISDRDVALVCAALASRANPNAVSDDDEPMLIHALRSALPTDTSFPIAEVLVKNGATVPHIGAYDGLSILAQEFIAKRQV